MTGVQTCALPISGDIEQVGTLTDLLVRGKADAQLAVGAALADDGLHSGHDLSHTGLIVCTQQGGAVGGDQGDRKSVVREMPEHFESEISQSSMIHPFDQCGPTIPS